MGITVIKLSFLAALTALLYWYASTVMVVLATVLIVAIPLGLAGTLLKALAFFVLPNK